MKDNKKVLGLDTGIKKGTKSCESLKISRSSRQQIVRKTPSAVVEYIRP
jgi:hypothetical protein